MDNGIGFAPKLLNNFGARRNKWRFYNKEDLVNKYLIEQVSFGYFSCFSMEKRIPFIGHGIDNFLFILDKLLEQFLPNKAIKNSVIVSLYKKN